MQSKLHSKGYFLKDKTIWTYFKLEIISVTLNNWEIRGFLWQVAHIPKTETWKLVINVTVVMHFLPNELYHFLLRDFKLSVFNVIVGLC